MTGRATDLDRIQRWLQSVIMHPDGVVAGINSDDARGQIDVSTDDVEHVIRCSSSQTSLERLNVYANAYYARLLECLRSEFPALAHALGEDLFNGFAFDYLQSYPSQSYTLAKLGENFPRYLRETRPADAEYPGWPDFLIDLAALERLYSEVFDGPGVEGRPLLSTDDPRAIPPERWPEAVLKPVPCLRLAAFDFPVHEYASAVRKGLPAAERSDPAAESPESSLPIPGPQPTWLVVTRRDFVVRRMPVTRPQYVLLEALVEGEPVGEAIQRAAEAREQESGVRSQPPDHQATSPRADQPTNLETLAADLQRWFRDWSAAGFFESVELPD